MIRIEPETSANPLFTTAQFLEAAAIITSHPGHHFDIVESRFKQDSITYTRLMLWRWPKQYREGDYPSRYWIEHTGAVSLIERCDWITPEEWPAWVGTPDTKETPS